MGTYIYDIKMAAITFPFIALLITLPFMIYNYHKYGSINFLKTILTYSFVLYLICAYFLIIMPLPSKEYVASLTTPRLQLIPFSFVLEAIKHFSFSLSFLKSSYFYVPIFNIILMIPLGIYLRYFLNCSLKKTIIITFFVSLFFELTQLSGLYGFYSRSYRLCDVDDLIQNTFGGFLGYLCGGLVTKFMPSMDEIKDKSIKKGMEVSGFRRTTAFFLDVIFILIFTFILNIFLDFKYILSLTIILYYFIIMIIFKGCTLSLKILKLKVVDNNNNFNIIRIIFRFLCFVLLYFIIPLGSLYLLFIPDTGEDILEIILLILALIVFLFYFIVFIKYVFTKKTMLYEKITKTKLISTIKEKRDKV